GVVLGISMRRPAIAAVLSAAVLVLLAWPALSMHTKLLSFSDLPHNLAIVKTYEKIQSAFPGSPAPAHLVVHGDDVTTPQFRQAFAELERRAPAARPGHQPIQIAVHPAQTGARLHLPPPRHRPGAAAPPAPDPP